MALRTPKADGLTIAPNAAGDVNNPAASVAELQAHRFWGRYATAAELPNAAGNAAADPAYNLMRPGDVGWVEADGLLYQLQDRGTLGGADAVWASMGGAVASTDRFAPTIIVGNTLAGDPAVAQVAPFRYIPDPGDGTGIQTALAEATALGTGAWVHIRRGTYTLAAAVLPLAVTANVRVTGDGAATVLVGRSDDRRVMTMAGSRCELSELRFSIVAAAVGATGASVLDASTSSDAQISSVRFVGPGTGINANESLTGIVSPGGNCLIQSCEATGIPTLGQAGQLAIIRATGPAASTRISECVLVGGDWNVLVQTGPTPSAVSVDNCRLQCNSVACVQAAGTGAAVRHCFFVSTDGAQAIIWSGSGVIMGNAAFGLQTFQLLGTSTATICVGNLATIVDAGTENEIAHNIPL